MKRIFSLLISVMLIVVMCFSVSAATSTDKIHITLSADNTNITLGNSFTISVAINANGTDDVSFDSTAQFGIFFDSTNLTEYEVDSTTAANYNTAEYLSDFDQFWFQADTLSCVNGTAVAKIKFTPSKVGEYTFTIDEDTGSTTFINGTDYWDTSNSGLVLTPVTVTVTAGSTEVTYPSLSEDTFTEGEEVFDGYTATAAATGITVFQKTAEDLAAESYGIQVVTGGKTYKFPGKVAITLGEATEKIWGIKIVAPAGTFSDGTTAFAPTSVKAYVGSTLSDELVK